MNRVEKNTLKYVKRYQLLYICSDLAKYSANLWVLWSWYCICSIRVGVTEPQMEELIKLHADNGEARIDLSIM